MQQSKDAGKDSQDSGSLFGKVEETIAPQAGSRPSPDVPTSKKNKKLSTRGEQNARGHEDAEKLAKQLNSKRLCGRCPLFVLGAGISQGVVPFLKDIGRWFWEKLESTLPAHRLARLLSDGKATRSDVAELFALLQSQEKPYVTLWDTFSQVFLLAKEDKILMGPGPGTRFDGLLKAQPTAEHETIARMMRNGVAWTLSLNFDGLTVKALRSPNGCGTALHTAKEVNQYFTSTQECETVPAVIKLRGDVFYARCSDALCPAAFSDQALDRLWNDGSPTDLVCRVCGKGRLRLQFLFPGFRYKEEAAFPVLWETRRFLGNRVSAIILLGLSARWDPYLLRFLFDWARERGVELIDVNPSKEDLDIVASFHRTNFADMQAPLLYECTAAAWLRSFASSFLET